MRRSKPAQQGSGNGLCGIYSLLNFLQNVDRFRDDPGLAYQQLILAAYKSRLLTPYQLCEGYQWFDLLEIFNIVARNSRLLYRAYPIDAVAEVMGSSSPAEVVRKTINEGGCAVIHINQGDHWVLAHTISGESFVVDDSSEATEPYELKGAGLARRGTDTIEGLSILPITSDLASKLDAQTH